METKTILVHINIEVDENAVVTDETIEKASRKSLETTQRFVVLCGK